MGEQIEGKVLYSSENLFSGNMGAIDIISQFMNTEDEIRSFCKKQKIQARFGNKKICLFRLLRNSQRKDSILCIIIR